MDAGLVAQTYKRVFPKPTGYKCQTCKKFYLEGDGGLVGSD